MPKAPTHAHIRQFKDEGYCAPCTFMRPEEMARFRARVEQFERNHPDAVGKLVQGPHLLFPWLVSMMRSDAVVDALEDLIGPDMVCASSGFRIKEPGRGMHAGWHQDAYYTKYESMWVTFLIAITNCTREKGCLQVIPGSFKLGVLPHAEGYDPDNILTRGQYITAEFDASKAVPMAGRAGQAVYFDNRTIHGSAPNRSTDRRINMLVDIAPTDAERNGPREPATLIHGVDDYRYFDEEPRPADEFGSLALARHRQVLELRNTMSYEGSNHVSPALA